ncbi:hydrogenase maturation protease [Thiobacillus sedimenti]|uniref:Hydrogenase maturation protease n=1 Tax=Thiobacillus sedimenti TaxID=3110231 RepID=A0ABZ1CNA6_9PROT|nr:hydrogenase maturation protease [Thiobacillus sp. SCUT-2]WRS40520.1 hydrogenase maturation protease [Thiobacillus sp. SCUT-2]
MKVRILGVGSPAGDDQAGWLVVDALLEAGVGTGERVVVAKLDRPGASLVPHLERCDWLILVDAMQGGGTPGEVRHFDEDDWPGYARGVSSHGFGVAEALALARALGSLPPRIDLYGIELGTAMPQAEPGPAVRASARHLAQRIAGSVAERA